MTRRAWKCKLTVLTFSVLASLASYGQLSAGFSANQVSGCAPIVVQFNDASTGNPTQWRWELGNGVVSFLQNPSTTYFNPGTYSVKLVVKNASGTDSIRKTSYITVHPNPVVAFTASDTSGCYPFSVQFTDQTNPSAASITGWQWDFGDGSISNAQHPSHVYQSAGNYTVTLKVTNSNGCVKTLSKTAYIRTTFGVDANFSVNKEFACKAPASFQFTNASSGPGTLSHIWDFGDGSQSTAKDPAHTYLANGIYTVKLITVSPQGCRDTMVKQQLIHVGTSPAFTAPSAVCQKAGFTVANTTQPAPSSMTWYFGDGSSSTDTNPVKSYNNPGVYLIKLVNDYGTCKDSIVKPITVFARPAINISVSKNNFCKVPFTVNFGGQAAGIVAYQWSFGDGGTSTAANPSHTYNSYGSFDVSLITTNTNGCRDTLVKPGYISIQKPIVAIDSLPRTGCNPLTIQPRPNVVVSDPVVSYLWNFGNGVTSTQQFPTYTYTQAGNYDVSLTITTANGCTETVTMVRGVRVGNKPKAGFTLQPPVVCVEQGIKFVDTSLGDVDQWLWNFGNTDFVTDQNPLWYFGPGYVNVTLTVWSNTCPDSIHLDSVAFVKPPFSSFDFVNSCSEKYTKRFTDKSLQAQSYFWKFGDGNTSTQKDPVHTYSTPGSYLVELTVFNDSCQHTSRKTVLVVDEKASFSHQRYVCKGSNVLFNSQGIKNANISTWLWDFGDGTHSTDSVFTNHVYTAPGDYVVKLTITDILGCVDARTDTITVYGPTASFSSNTSISCFTANNIVFTDLSTTDGIHPLVEWIWNYGDGVVDTASTSAAQHQYSTPGEYPVSLFVTDAYGCTSSFGLPTPIVIAQPKADFVSPDTLYCTDKPVAFQNLSTGADLQYAWSFGDGQTSTQEHPTHPYGGVGDFTIQLKVTDKYGCVDSMVRRQYIRIDLPKADFTMSDSVGTCPPMLVTFTNTSKHYTSIEWDFGDGNTSSLQNPSHYYTVSGVYFVKLVITSPGGCKDSISKKIVLKGPRGTFSYSPQEGCKPLTLTLTATSFDRESIVWDFSDGTTYSGLDSVITHVYTQPGEYVPKMILVDAAGCSVPVTGEDTIRVTGVIATYGVNAASFCDAGLVVFDNTSVSNDLITGWQWSFGDGTGSTDQSPSHYYATPGTYTTKLFVYTQSGCVDSSIALPITIHPSPVISIGGDTTGCAPAVLDFIGTTSFADSLSWQWDFGNGHSADVHDPQPETFSQGSYVLTATATDVNGCADTASRMVVISPIPLVNAGPDGLVCQGGTRMLSATGAQSYTWEADPALSCLNCPNPVASPTDTSTYVVRGFNAAGCFDTDTVKLFVRFPFNLQVRPSDSVCLGETVQLMASGTDHYQWTPSIGLDDAGSSSPKATPTTTTTYTVTARDKDNCFTSTATVAVKVNPIPTVDAGPDQVLTVGSSMQLKTKTSADVITWDWTLPYTLSCASCPEPLAKPRSTTTYRVDVTNAGGCRASDDITISVICNNGNFYLPNTFSPNNDGMNDRFYPRGTGIARIKSFRIYNRWGEVIFEKINFNANDPAAGWDGTYKGKKLPPDVFIYTCDVICENSSVLPFKGDVTLLQ